MPFHYFKGKVLVLYFIYLFSGVVHHFLIEANTDSAEFCQGKFLLIQVLKIQSNLRVAL